jgi:hypothetical protein
MSPVTEGTYADDVNRNSPLAKKLSVQTGIRARRIEGWTVQGLGANPTFPFAEQVSHYLELVKLAGPGRSKNADLTARRLASHSFECTRLRR